MQNAHILKSLDFPFLRQMCYAPTCRNSAVSKAFQKASIVSVHSFYRFHCLWVNQSFKRWKTPYWHVPHGILDPYVLSYGRLAKQFYLKAGGKAFLDNAACTIFATKREQEKAESVFGAMRGEVVHWPVELLELNDREVRRKALRRRMGIPEDAVVLLYFGRVQAMKRPFEIIRAAAAAKSERLHLLMVGPLEGIDEKTLRQRVKDAGLNNFHYAGGVFGENKYDYLFASDAYASFSIRENFNHTAAESMSAGLPVILSPGNDLAPLVEQAGAGWCLADDSIRALQSAIEELLGKSEAILMEHGLAGRRLVEREFSYDSFKVRLLDLSKRYGRS